MDVEIGRRQLRSCVGPVGELGEARVGRGSWLVHGCCFEKSLSFFFLGSALRYLFFLMVQANEQLLKGFEFAAWEL